MSCSFKGIYFGKVQDRHVIPEILFLDKLLGEGRRHDNVHERRRALPTPSDSTSQSPPVTIPGAQRIPSGVFSTLKRNCQLIHACSAGQHGKTPDFLHLPIRASTDCRRAFSVAWCQPSSIYLRHSTARCSDRPFMNAFHWANGVAWLGGVHCA